MLHAHSISENWQGLVKFKSTPFDTKHSLRIAFGNGMRPSHEFLKAFQNTRNW